MVNLFIPDLIFRFSKVLLNCTWSSLRDVDYLPLYIQKKPLTYSLSLLLCIKAHTQNPFIIQIKLEENILWKLGETKVENAS